MGDCFGTPGTSGMGSNIEVTKRQVDDLSSWPLTCDCTLPISIAFYSQQQGGHKGQ